MKTTIIITSLILLLGCQENKNKTMQENNDYLFYVGTYTNGDSQGIYKYILQNNGTLKKSGLVAKSNNPSFLAKSIDNKFLIAVNEIDNEGTGTVESFLITDDSLEFISRSKSGGAHPCFVSINENGFILTANYTGGNVGLLKIDKKGELSNTLHVQQHTGKGTTERQQAPHAHSAWFAPDSNNIISVDLGTNELWFSRLDTIEQELLPSNPNTFSMKPGAGPRHLTFHPNGKWIYVLNELNCTMVLLQKLDNGKYKANVPVSTLPSSYAKPNTAADIHISADGNFLYVSNRGHNTIAIYSVNKSDGTLNTVGYEPTKGDGPRNFTLSPNNKHLLVANQHTNNIVLFKRNVKTGLLTYMSQIEAPTPVCILF